jgi:hypothetical protein
VEKAKAVALDILGKTMASVNCHGTLQICETETWADEERIYVPAKSIWINSDFAKELKRFLNENVPE